MKLPYNKALTASTLYRNGVSYHAFGVIKQGKTMLFDYYKCDKVTDEQAEALRQFCPDMQVKGCRAEYAPELRSVLLCFPKAAWYRAQGSAA